MEARLEALTSEYQKLQKGQMKKDNYFYDYTRFGLILISILTDLSNAIESRQRLDSQLQENEVVQKVSYLYGRQNLTKLGLFKHD
jgi:hypothetical protein